MAHTKRRARQHIMEDQSYIILKSTLPEEWAIHEYRPDYGIDLVVEIFRFIDEKRDLADSLGELVFLQLKSVNKVDIKTLSVQPRGNVEKTDSRNRTGDALKIDVISFDIDTDELLTVQTMGPTIAVMLCLVCLDSRRIFFVCLNDLLEKVILINNPDYTKKSNKRVHIPVKNEINSNADNLVALRFYAKRPKFYAAFNKFHYQQNEIRYLLGFGKPGIYTQRDEIERRLKRDLEVELRPMLSRFIRILMGLDIWHDSEMWAIVGDYYEALVQFQNLLEDVAVPTETIASQALLLWNGLTVLSSNYEELCREWYLPTHLSQYLSYPELP